MTDRERFLATMQFEPVDRVPYHELGLWGHTVELYIQAGMPVQAATANFFEGNDWLGLDRREFVPLDIGPLPPFQEEVLEQTSRYEVYRDGWGTVHKALREDTVRGTRASMDQYVDFAVKNPEDWARIKDRFDARSRLRWPENWDELVSRWRTRDCPLCLLTNGTFGFYSMLRRLMGTENASFAFFDYPAMVHEMVAFFADFLIELTTPALQQCDVDYFNFFEDFAGKGGPLVSPRLFRKFLLPGYRRVVEHLHKHGVRFVWLDSDGNTEALIPLLLEAGITCHWPCEIAAGMDPVRLRREYGRDLALAGGIDKRALTRGKKEIEQELHYRLPPLLESGGYIPTIDHTVPPDIPYENFMYYMALKKRIAEKG